MKDADAHGPLVVGRYQAAADSSFKVLFVVENAKVVTWLIR